MGEDWKKALTFRTEKETGKVESSIIVGGLTISVGDIITVTETEKVFLPYGVARKDLKVQSIDPENRIITFEGYEYPLHLVIVKDGLVTLSKSGSESGEQEKKPIKEPQVGDLIRLASNYGPILMINDERGAPVNNNRSESQQKLDTGAIIEQVLQDGLLVVRSVMPNDKRRFLITFSNKVRKVRRD